MDQAHFQTSNPGRAETVGVMILTMNRKLLLAKCIEAVGKQTRPVDAILVIDNYSSDGTLEYIREHYPDVEVIRQERNRGSAGGFGEGLRIAHERGFDWIWMMDDDVEVRPGALEELLKYRHIGKFIQGRRRGPEGMLPLEAFWDASMGTCLTMPREISFEQAERDWVPVQWGCFEGPLVHRSVVDACGLPDERFFLSGDDMMYGLRASFYTTVVYIRSVVLDRQLACPTVVTPLRWYLMMRNRFLIVEHLKGYGVPLDEKYFRLGMLKLALWCTWSTVRTPRRDIRKWDTIRMTWLGLRDGLRGRFGSPSV